MERIRQFLSSLWPKSAFARSVSILAGGTALTQAVSLLSAPVLTRLYTAEHFGYFQIYVSFMAFAVLAVTLRYEQAIFLPERDDVAANLTSVTLCAVLLMTLLFSLAAWCVYRFVTLPPNATGLRPYLWLVPVGIFGAGLYQTFSFWALRQKAYSRVVSTRLAQAGSMAGLQMGLGAAHLGTVGLLVGDVVGRITGCFSLARLSWTASRDAFRSVRASSMWSAAVRYRRFPLVSSGSALIGVAAYSVPPFLIAYFFGAKTLGWFALSDRVLGIPATLIGHAVSQVYSVEASSLSNSDPAALRGLFFRSIKRLVLLGAIPFALFVLLSPLLFSFVFGAAWREAGVYARVLALMHYVAFVVWPLTPTLNILEQQFWQLGWDAGRLVLTVSSLWITHLAGLSARAAVGSLALAMIVGYAVFLLLAHRAIAGRMRQFDSSKSISVGVP